MSQIGKNLVSALKIKYTSEIQCAIATLQVYVNHPVGIGEHPQHLEEIDKQLQKSVDAREKKEILKKL